MVLRTYRAYGTYHAASNAETEMAYLGPCWFDSRPRGKEKRSLVEWTQGSKDGAKTVETMQRLPKIMEDSYSSIDAMSCLFSHDGDLQKRT